MKIETGSHKKILDIVFLSLLTFKNGFVDSTNKLIQNLSLTMCVSQKKWKVSYLFSF